MSDEELEEYLTDSVDSVTCPFCGYENFGHRRNCKNCGWILKDD